jgi:WD40 repeat protein
VWDAQSGQQLAAIRHPCEVLGAFWSSDATWLATASADGQLRFWSTDEDPGTPPGRTAEGALAALSFARAPQSGLVAFGLNNFMIHVLCFTNA